MESVVDVGRLVSGFWLVPFFFREQRKFQRTRQQGVAATVKQKCGNRRQMFGLALEQVQQAQKTSGSDDWHDGAAFKQRPGAAPKP